MEYTSIRRVVIIVAITIAVIVTLLFGLKMFTQVDNGHIGVVKEFGAATGEAFPPGLHIINPFTQDVDQIDLRTQVITITTYPGTRDLQGMVSNIGLAYHIDPASVVQVYKTISIPALEKNVQQIWVESYKQATGRYIAEEFAQKREEIRETAYQLMKARAAQQHVIIEDFFIYDYDFTSQEFKQAIEDKQVAAQKVLKAQQEQQEQTIRNQTAISVAETQKQQVILDAQGKSEAQKLQQQSLTDLYLKAQWIAKWNGILPTMMAGDSGVLLNLPAQTPTTP